MSNNKEIIEFYGYKHELSPILDKLNHVIEDNHDFWKFVRKYEEVRKKKGNSCQNEKKANCTSLNALNIPNHYDPSYLVNININMTDEDLQDCLVVDKRHKLRKYLDKFVFLITLYINYKQKEKLEKLKKIRTSQQNLPVYQFRDEILNAVANHKVVIIAGDTGCGKSTQIPQYLWEAGYNKIGCTQPRRIACISLSKRVGYETLTQNSPIVGYQIRFEKRKNQDTKILFITEGLLLRQASSEGMLSEYDVIVLDEVHERHLQGDFLLGITKCIAHQRDDIKLVLMSATINIDLFSKYFGDMAKVIQVPGRLFPISVQYFPAPTVDTTDRFDPSPYIRILQLIDDKYPKNERGDVLMFLSGTKEITAVVDAAQEYNEKRQSWCILPLHSSMSLAEQDKVFDYPPEGFRKCVVSTNIAETSVTIDGIRFVVDSGKVKEMSYDNVGRLQRLKEFWISKASAEQRKGRAGRTGPGVCFRLFSEDEYSAMSEYTTPEIQRVSLDSVLLQMLAMGLSNVRKFPFIEPPNEDTIEGALISLKQHGAINDDEKLSQMGRTLSKLPVDILMGKMLIMGSMFQQFESILSLAAALSVQSPYTHKAFRDKDMLDSRTDMDSDHGDPITLLNVLREWLQLKYELTQERGNQSYKSRKWCKKRGLEEQRFYEVTKLRTQFQDLLLDCGLINEDGSIKKGKSELTSAERSARHGELKQLRQLKRAHENDNSSSKPKILKVDQVEVEFQDGEEKEDKTTDLRDIEFRMRNDPSQVKNLLDGISTRSNRDMMMVKIILCYALYPQIAIPDEYNTSKTVKEQLFHTCDKPFVSLHPNSYFAFNSEHLILDNCDIIKPPLHFHSKSSISNRHQILFYLSLLETTKVYLVNNIRMPAAQSVLLFSQSIQCNKHFTKFICDRWIEIRFVSPLAGENLILQICKVRHMWENLLNTRLQTEQNPECNDLDEELTDLLLKLFRADVHYTIRRLLPADLKNLNNCNTAWITKGGDKIDLDAENPFNADYKLNPNPKYGGVNVSQFLTYNCLMADENDEVEPWKCEKCDDLVIFAPFQRLLHLKQHERDKTEEIGSSYIPKSVKPNARMYDCDVCKKKLFLTSTEILKHRREHVT